MKTYDMPFLIWDIIADHVLLRGAGLDWTGDKLYSEVENYIADKYGLGEADAGSLIYKIIDEKKFILFSLRFM